jgi:hypothetical protein
MSITSKLKRILEIEPKRRRKSAKKKKSKAKRRTPPRRADGRFKKK